MIVWSEANAASRGHDGCGRIGRSGWNCGGACFFWVDLGLVWSAIGFREGDYVLNCGVVICRFLWCSGVGHLASADFQKGMAGARAESSLKA